MSDNVNVPRQALEQLERLEALELQNAQPPAGTDQQPAAPNADATIVAPAAEAEPLPPVVAPVEPIALEVRADWKAKYLVLKGKFDAEVPRFAAENRQLRTANQQLTDDLAASKATAAPVQGNTAPTNDLESQFDPDLVRFVKDQIQANTKPLQQELETNRAVQAKTAHEVFLESVNDMVPDFAEIDATDAFQNWANDLDVVSGKTYGELIDDAALTRNPARIKAIYDKFRSEKMGPAQPVATSAAFVPKPLEDRVVPQSSVDHGQSLVDKPSFTRAQISKFYADVSRGAYEGNVAEQEKIDAQITLAQQEGRVE